MKLYELGSVSEETKNQALGVVLDGSQLPNILEFPGVEVLAL